MKKSLPDPHPSQLRYRRLFETAQGGILMVNATTGLIEEVNPFLAELLGYSAAELIGKPLWEIDPVIDKPRTKAAFAVLQNQGYLRDEDLPLRTKAGRIINVEFVSNRYALEHGNVIQCNVRDVSDRRENERLKQEYARSLLMTLREITETLVALIEVRDPYTAGHQARVADLAAAIAGEMALSAPVIEGVRVSAMLHDIGKVGISLDILTKLTNLDPDELGLLQTHVQIGYDILKRIHFPWPVAQAVLQHHERLDGSGYPYGLAGNEIIEEARIVAVADLVDAMTMNRPYRSSPGLEAALDLLRAERGRQFDPLVVDACLTLFKTKHYTFPPAGMSGKG